jgi:hypothetical protein
VFSSHNFSQHLHRSLIIPVTPHLNKVQLFYNVPFLFYFYFFFVFLFFVFCCKLYIFNCVFLESKTELEDLRVQLGDALALLHTTEQELFENKQLTLKYQYNIFY